MKNILQSTKNKLSFSIYIYILLLMPKISQATTQACTSGSNSLPFYDPLNSSLTRLLTHHAFVRRLVLTCLILITLFTNVVKAQCGDGSTNNGDCNSFGGVTYIADVTTVPSVGLNTWNTLSTTNLSKPYWVFKNVQRGTIIRLANCTGEDSEFSISGPSGFTYIKRDGDNEFNVGLGCSPNGNDESMYLYCTQTGDYNISIIRNGCNNFSNAGTKYLYWNVTNRPCSGGTSYGSGVWNGYVYDGTGPDYFYGSIGTQPANDINVNWGTGQPIGSGCGNMCDADNFSTLWFMNQTYSDGVYVFSTPGNDDGRVLSTNLTSQISSHISLLLCNLPLKNQQKQIKYTKNITTFV